MEYLGLPLRIFGKENRLYPLISLYELDVLNEARGFLIGCTNRMVAESNQLKVDCIIDLDKLKVDFKEDLPRFAKKMSKAEKQFFKGIQPKLAPRTEYDYLHFENRDTAAASQDDKFRAAFHLFYAKMLTRLSLTKLSLEKSRTLNIKEESEGSDSSSEKKDDSVKTLLYAYKIKFIAAFTQTPAFHCWNKHHYQKLGLTDESVESKETVKRVYDNGDVYLGQFSGGIRNGHGELIDSEKAVYRGNWRDDMVTV